MQICSSCGEENPDRFRLCGFCGTPLATPVPAAEFRKTVTIVFSDLKGSTSLGEQLDAEAIRAVMLRYFEAMRLELMRHGGTVSKFIGDAVMAVFGMPITHEDDALRAVRAAAGMRASLAALNDDLDRTFGVRLDSRTGVYTGEVVAGDVDPTQGLVVGDAVNTAARLEQSAPANEILLGALTYQLVRGWVDAEPVEALELKGKEGRVPAYRLVGIHSGRAADTADTLMVGRKLELELLRDSLRESVRAASVRIVTIIGDAGVGKSRLTREFLAGIGDAAMVARGQCLPYGEGITFWPLVEIVRDAAGILEDDPADRARALLFQLLGDEQIVDRVASATGMSSDEFTLQELFWGFRRFIEIIGADRPVVLVIDDIQWAEPTLLDLLEYLVETEHKVATLLVCTSRNDLRETRPSFREMSGARHLVLAALTSADTSHVVESLLGRAGVADEVKLRVVDAAEGNPLFVEQLVSMLTEQGALTLVDDRWVATGDLSNIDIPPTINALLAARLDGLSADERTVVQPAAVIGLTFPEPAVEALVPESLRPDVSAHFEELRRKQLVRASDQPGYTETDQRFHHVLIRDAAYRSVLKRTRAQLHEGFVEWSDARDEDRDRSLESEEILGYHLEQAYRLLSELGPLDEDGRLVGSRGSERLAGAGRRAFVRGDMPAASSLLRRAAELLETGSARRVTLLTDAGEALTEAGELSVAYDVLDRAISEARDLGDRPLETAAHVVRLYLRYITEGQREERIAEQLSDAIAILEKANDHRSLTRAWRIYTNVHFAACRWQDAEEAARQMIEHARLAGDRAMEMRVLTALATCAELGPTPVPEAIIVCQQVLADLGGDQRSEAYVRRSIANLEAMQGRFDEARRLYRESRKTLVDLGWKHSAALTAAAASGPIELLAGDPAAAEKELRRDYDALDLMGERNYICTTSAFLAEALYRQGRYDESERYTDVTESLAADDDVTTQVLWRSVRAKLHARRQQFGDARALAEEAVRIISLAQDPDAQANALLDLGEVLSLEQDRARATEVVAQAAALFSRKGNVVAEARARAVLDGLTG